MNAGKISGSLWRFGLKFESDIDAGHRYQTLDTGYQISDIRHQTSDIGHHKVDIGYGTSDVRHQTLDRQT